MKIRLMEEGDIPEVADSHASSWRKAFRGILSDKLLDEFSADKLVEAWKEIIGRNNRINLVVEDGGKVVGFIGFEKNSEKKKSGEVIGIYVHPDSWRKGAGKALMDAGLERMRGLGFESVYLWTMAENRISRSFYVREGFLCSNQTRISERQGESFQEIQFTKIIKAEPVAGGDATRWRS